MSRKAHSLWVLVLALVSLVGLAPFTAAQTVRKPPTLEQRQKLDEAIQKKLVPVEAVFDGIWVSKLGEPAPGDDAHRALLRQRLMVARRAALNRVILFKAGSARVNVLGLIESIQRLADARLALLDQPAQRAAAWEQAVVIAAVIEDVNGLRFDEGQIPIQDLHLSREFHAACRLAVLDAKQSPVAPRPKRTYPPAPPPGPKILPAVAPLSAAELAKEREKFDKEMDELTTKLRHMFDDETLAAPAPGDDDRRRLLKARHLARLRETREFTDQFLDFPGVTVPLMSSLRHLAASELALNDQPASRLAVAERDVQFTRGLEKVTMWVFNSGRIPISDFENPVRYHCLTAEINLLELRAQFPNVEVVKPALPAKVPAGQPRAAPVLTADEQAEMEKLLPRSELDPATGAKRWVFSDEFRRLPKPFFSVEPAAGDDERRKLLKARHRWAAEGLEGLFLATAGSPPLEVVERFRTSAIALSDRPADHVVVEERVLALLRVVELANKSRASADPTTPINSLQYDASAAARLDAELRVFDARRRAAAPPGPRKQIGDPQNGT